MNPKNISAIAHKEFHEHKYRFLITLISIPAVSGIFFMPHLFSQTSFLEDLIRQFHKLYSGYPADLKRQIILIDVQLPIYILVPAFACPFFGILESIIGEKDARTLEGLFSLPISRWEILFGKILPSIGGAIFVSWFTYFYHLIFLWIFCGEQLAVHLITPKWGLILVFLIPAIVYMIGITAILISMRVKRIQTAVNLSTIIFAPVFFGLTAIGLGYLEFDLNLLLAVGCILLVLGILMTFIVRQLFSVERLIRKMYD